MNRIILIGNGFDLAHDLKTSYRDFINWFWEKEIKRIQQNSETQFAIPHLHIKNYEDNIVKIVNPQYQYTELNTDRMFSNYKELKYSVNKSFLIIKNTLLELVSDKINILNNWVDIENEYYEKLKNVLNEASLYGKDVKLLNSHFEQIKLELEEYLTAATKEPIEKIAGLENFIFSKFDLTDFTEQGRDNLIDIAYQKILSLKEKDDKQELSVLNTSESTIILYGNIKALVSKEKPIIHESLRYSLYTRADFVKLLKKRKDSIEISSLLSPENVLFLNFNYTNTENKYSVDNYFANKEEGYKQEFKINQETIHIHGELNNPKNPIIFGYGDELDDDYKQILNKNDNNLLENVKSIKYGETYNYRKLLNFVESDNYQIFIMGHSCGNSDRTLLNTLFEHKNCQSIKIFYYEKFNDQREKLSDDFSNIYRNITRNFKNFANLRAKVVDKTNSIPFPQLRTNN
jgi:hypothetical protein